MIGRTRVVGSVALAAIVSVGLVTASTATAAPITWGDVFEVVTDADIDMSLPVVVEALNAGDEPLGNIDVTLSGRTVTFTPAGIFGGSNTGAGGMPEMASTGNANLDQIWESHSWQGGSYPPDAALPFTLGGLNVGQDYQVQLIAAADGRSCCATRTQVFQDTADGTGNNSGEVARGSNDLVDGTALAGSVIGTFTADAATQSVWISGATDPGLTAFLVTTIPEPSSVVLLTLVCLGLVTRTVRRHA